MCPKAPYQRRRSHGYGFALDGPGDAANGRVNAPNGGAVAGDYPQVPGFGRTSDGWAGQLHEPGLAEVKPADLGLGLEDERIQHQQPGGIRGPVLG